MEIKIRFIVDDTFKYHYRVQHSGKVFFLMAGDHVSADAKLVSYLRRRLGVPIDEGIMVCEKLIEQDEVIIDVPFDKFN